MTQDLKEYLLKRWVKCNHKKHHKYFNDWIVNITESQIMYFTKEMINLR